jgi:ribosomal protein L25 (general stress protein Ctc)
MSDVTIAATTRTVSGKGNCRKLRAAGQVPAVLNTGGKSTLLALDPKLLSKAWQGGKKFVLDLGGQKSNVKITELQIHPVRRLPLHVDLAPAD